jgi:hypothetical protein
MSMSKALRRVAIAASLGGLSLGCGSQEGPAATGPATFLVEVLGSDQALQQFTISASGFETTSTRTRFASRQPLAKPAAQPYGLSTRLGDQPKGKVSLAPYICAQMPDFRTKIGDGWKMREVHQVFLAADGALEVDTDFDHPLSYWCETMPPGIENHSESVGELTGAPMWCADETRKNTEVRLDGSYAGAAFDLRPELCSSVITGNEHGRVDVAFIAHFGEIELSATLKHCVALEETYPLDLRSEAGGCAFEATSEAFNYKTGSRFFPLVKGTWTISSASFAKGGRVRGSFDVSFERAPERLHAAGSFDLPILRAPVASL